MQTFLCSNCNISQRQEVSSESNCWPEPSFSDHLASKPSWSAPHQIDFLSTETYLNMQNCLSLPASELSKFVFLEILFCLHRLSCLKVGVMSIAVAFCKMWEKTFLLPISKRVQQNVTAMKKLVLWLQLSPRWPFQENCGCQCLFRCKNPSLTETLPAWELLHDWLS